MDIRKEYKIMGLGLFVGGIALGFIGGFVVITVIAFKIVINDFNDLPI
jgi:hypothetical protein